MLCFFCKDEIKKIACCFWRGACISDNEAYARNIESIPHFVLIFRPFLVKKGASIFIPIYGICFKIKTNTVVRTGYVHFIFFFITSVCKITAASNDFAPCIYLYHRFGTHSGWTFVLKNKLISFF